MERTPCSLSYKVKFLKPYDTNNLNLTGRSFDLVRYPIEEHCKPSTRVRSKWRSKGSPDRDRIRDHLWAAYHPSYDSELSIIKWFVQLNLREKYFDGSTAALLVVIKHSTNITLFNTWLMIPFLILKYITDFTFALLEQMNWILHGKMSRE